MSTSCTINVSVELDDSDIDVAAQLALFNVGEYGVQSINGLDGVVTLDLDDLDTSVTGAELDADHQFLTTQSGINTGDQDLSGIEGDIDALEARDWVLITVNTYASSAPPSNYPIGRFYVMRVDNFIGGGYPREYGVLYTDTRSARNSSFVFQVYKETDGKIYTRTGITNGDTWEPWQQTITAENGTISDDLELSGKITVPNNNGTDTDEVLSYAQAAARYQGLLAEGAFVDGDKTNLDNQSGINTGDQDGTQVELIDGGGVSVTQAISDLDSVKSDKSNVLEKDNTTSYTPTADYHPSTKEYCDGRIADYIEPQALTSATNVSYDLALGPNATLTPTADGQTIDLPTNYAAGMAGACVITSDSGYSVNLGTGWFLSGGDMADIAGGANGDKFVLAWYAVSSGLFTATLTPAQ